MGGDLFTGNIDLPIFSRKARANIIEAGKLDWYEINPDVLQLEKMTLKLYPLSHPEHHRRVHEGGPGHPCQTQAQFPRRCRRLDRFVHPARPTGIHNVRQWRGVYCKEGARLDRRGGNQDGLHRTGFTLGKRLLRELQRTVPRRTFEW